MRHYYREYDRIISKHVYLQTRKLHHKVLITKKNMSRDRVTTGDKRAVAVSHERIPTLYGVSV
jgi:hypothetical protein